MSSVNNHSHRFLDINTAHNTVQAGRKKVPQQSDTLSRNNNRGGVSRETDKLLQDQSSQGEVNEVPPYLINTRKQVDKEVGSIALNVDHSWGPERTTLARCLDEDGLRHVTRSGIQTKELEVYECKQ